MSISSVTELGVAEVVDVNAWVAEAEMEVAADSYFGIHAGEAQGDDTSWGLEDNTAVNVVDVGHMLFLREM